MGKIKSRHTATPGEAGEYRKMIELQLHELIADAGKYGWSEIETLAAVAEAADNISRRKSDDFERAQLLAAVTRMRG